MKNRVFLWSYKDQVTVMVQAISWEEAVKKVVDRQLLNSIQLSEFKQSFPDLEFHSKTDKFLHVS